jgi:hypothetical protein
MTNIEWVTGCVGFYLEKLYTQLCFLFRNIIFNNVMLNDAYDIF